MAKQPFRLETLLRLRKQQLQQVEMELLRCQSELHAWQQREQEIRESIQRLSSSTDQATALTTDWMVAVHLELRARTRQLSEAQTQQRVATQKLLQARERHRVMNTEVEKITTLKDEHTKEARRQLLTLETQQLSDLPLRDWQPHD
jgi:hypothetical protein